MRASEFLLKEGSKTPVVENTNQAAVDALMKKYGWSMGRTANGDLAFTWQGSKYEFFGERVRITLPDGKSISVVWDKKPDWQGRGNDELSFAQAVQNKYLTFDLPIWQALNRGQLTDSQAIQKFKAENERQAREAVAQGQLGVAEGATVTRIDSKPITDFGSSLKAYKHTDDWSQSGVDTGDDSYWKNKNLKTNTTKGLFAGDPKRTALYATGNAHETRYVEFTQNGQPIVYFDQKDLPAMRSRKTYLTVFDANDFRQLPTGEWFSENPGKPIKQIPIGDPFKYIASQGWIVRVTDDLDKVFKQVKNMHKAGKIAQYGAEGMNESKQGVAEGTEQKPVVIYTNHRGATIDDDIKKSLRTTQEPFNKLQMWEKHKSMKDPKIADWVTNKLLPELKQNGVLKPLLVWNNNGQLFVIDGNHRFLAYQEAGYRGRVPVQIVPDNMIIVSDTVPGQQGVAENFADGQNPVKFTVTTPDGYTHSFQITLAVHGKHVGHFNFVRGADTDDVNNEAEVESRWQGQGYGKLLLMKAIDVANNHGLDFQQDIRGITHAQQNVYDSLENAGSIVTPGDGFWFLTPQGEQELNGLNENFADGKNPQDKGDSKRHGVPTKASVSTLRKVAKQGGRKGQLAHWMANMKAGKAKHNK